MRNLVWTFWLALILSIIGTFIASVFLMRQWSNFVSYSEMEESNNFNFRFLAISREIENTLNKNGNLETLLLDHPIKDFAEIYLIDQEGIDALGRTLPERLTLARYTNGVINVKDNLSTNTPILVQGIKTDLDDFYTVVAYLDSTSFTLWNFFKRFGLYWILFAALIVSGIISWILVVKITRPIQDLALASDRQGKGDLVTIIDRKILERSDEIGGLARQLQSSGIKIKSLLSKQKDFLRDISHEVRTPLARLQISAENLELDTNDKQALNQIKKEVQIIDKLVQDLLHLSYFDQPSKSHKIESIQLIDLVDHFVQRSQILASHKNISVTLKSIKQQNLSVAGVHFLLDRALDNLMSNAIRHSSQYSEIRVSCEIDKEYCYVGIRDQGEGVSEERLEEIFEPFVRLDSSRNRSTGGFGLGLSLVKRIAVMHNGSVIASNIFNESSTQTEGFVVKLILPLENKIEALKD